LIKRLSLEKFNSLELTEAREFRLADVSLLTIYNILFDVKEIKSAITQEELSSLGHLLYGEESINQIKQHSLEETKEKYKTEIRKNFPKAQSLLDTALRQLRSGTVHLVNADTGNESVIACLIPNYKSPLTEKDLFELARILYPEEIGFIKERVIQADYQAQLKANRNFLIQELKNKIGDQIGQWKNKNHEFKRTFKLGGLGVIAIHTLLGFSQSSRMNEIWKNIMSVVLPVEPR
jgi:hypothetical protein